MDSNQKFKILLLQSALFMVCMMCLVYSSIVFYDYNHLKEYSCIYTKLFVDKSVCGKFDCWNVYAIVEYYNDISMNYAVLTGTLSNDNELDHVMNIYNSSLSFPCYYAYINTPTIVTYNKLTINNSYTIIIFTFGLAGIVLFLTEIIYGMCTNKSDQLITEQNN